MSFQSLVDGFCCRTGRPFKKGDLVTYTPGVGLTLPDAAAPSRTPAQPPTTFKVGQRVLFGRRRELKRSVLEDPPER